MFWLGNSVQASPASAITAGGIAGQTTPRAASSALARAIQCAITSPTGVPSGNSSLSRAAAAINVSVEAEKLIVV